MFVGENVSVNVHKSINLKVKVKKTAKTVLFFNKLLGVFLEFFRWCKTTAQ